MTFIDEYFLADFGPGESEPSGGLLLCAQWKRHHSVDGGQQWTPPHHSGQPPGRPIAHHLRPGRLPLPIVGELRDFLKFHPILIIFFSFSLSSKRKKNQPAPIMVTQQPKLVSELYSDNTNAPPVTATLRRMPINPLARPSCRRVVPIQGPALSGPPPAPPMPPSAAQQQQQQQSRPGSSDNNNENGRPHIVHQLNGHQLAWPSHASLPKRVKKLSWEDEFNVFF